jgi:methyl-accepting chemotaxis protein
MDTASATEETSASLDQITQVVGEINGVAEQVDQEIRKFRTSS